MNLNFIKKNNGDITIVFIHGNSFSLEIFQNQFSDPLFDNYSLIAMDLPGHGKSPAPKKKEEVYSVTGLANVLGDFINDVVKNPVVLVGYSMSGNLVIEIAPKLNNVLGIFFNGTPPLSSTADIPRGYFPDNNLAEVFLEDNLDDEKLNVFCRCCTNENYKYDALIKGMISRTDKNFRSMLGASVMHEKIGDEVKILKELKIPLAILHGEEDVVLVNPDYLKSLNIPTLWRNEIKIIKTAPHLAHLVYSMQFNKLLKEFMEDITA